MGDAFRERLRRLRREPGSDEASVPAAAPGGRAELPGWLRARLARAPGRAEEHAADRARTTGEPQGLAEVRGSEGCFAARDTHLAGSSRHGEYALTEALQAERGALALLSRGTLPDELDVARAVFLDIETTGLSGGAGTQAFLVGLGWFEGDGFVVHQAFLRGPEEERALLAACAERVGAARLLVSFFGKSFDRHRLEDKMRLHGLRAPFDGLPHADLYWPCRRLYGAATPDTRLATMERALCGVTRDGDLSGAHAPAAWFDFLAGRAHLLEEVFRHNLADVLSLVTLYAHLGSAAREHRAGGVALGGPAPLAAARARTLAELHLERGENGQALSWVERARGRCVDARPLAVLHARILAAEGELEQAVGILRSAAEGSRDALAAEALVAAGALALRAGLDVETAGELARRGVGLAAVTTSGSRRARLERSAATTAARCARRARRA